MYNSIYFMYTLYTEWELGAPHVNMRGLVVSACPMKKAFPGDVGTPQHWIYEDYAGRWEDLINVKHHWLSNIDVIGCLNHDTC